MKNLMLFATCNKKLRCNLYLSFFDDKESRLKSIVIILFVLSHNKVLYYTAVYKIEIIEHDHTR